MEAKLVLSAAREQLRLGVQLLESSRDNLRAIDQITDADTVVDAIIAARRVLINIERRISQLDKIRRPQVRP
jgi:predicted nucleic acid-binding protein